MTNRAYYDEYKGQTIIHLEGEKVSIAFGHNKACTLQDNLDLVAEFAVEGKVEPNDRGVIVEQFKGQPILVLPHDSKYPFSFGQKKAELIALFADEVDNFATTGKARDVNEGP
jgi:hypothetical protein